MLGQYCWYQNRSPINLNCLTPSVQNYYQYLQVIFKIFDGIVFPHLISNNESFTTSIIGNTLDFTSAFLKYHAQKVVNVYE